MSAQLDFEGYWNTTHLRGPELAEARAVTGEQDAAVLAIFQRNRGKPLTPSQVWRFGCDEGRHWLLTSVRRAISNLTDKKHLQQLDLHVPGPYGRPETCWQAR